MSSYTDYSTTDSKVDVLDRLDAMLDQEESAAQCYNYLARGACHESEIDEECRSSMITWCQQVRKALKLNAETVWIGASFLDRYLSSGKGKSADALEDKYKFQLTAITSFYLAVKLYERVNLDVPTLAKMCRGYYAEDDIVATEEDILFALDFRVATPTPMDFVREYVQLLPAKVESKTERLIVKTALKHLEHATSDFYMSFYAPSAVGAACLSSALLSIDVLNTNERQAFWMQLARTADLIEIMEVQNKLLEGKTLCKPVVVQDEKKPVKKAVAKAVASRHTLGGGDSSPVCIAQTSRAA